MPKQHLVFKDEAPEAGKTFQVRTMHLPYYMAVDETLKAAVDRRMNERFVGRRYVTGDERLLDEMDREVIEAVLERYPVSGLREVLEAIANMDPTEKAPQCAGEAAP